MNAPDFAAIARQTVDQLGVDPKRANVRAAAELVLRDTAEAVWRMIDAHPSSQGRTAEVGA